MPGQSLKNSIRSFVFHESIVSKKDLYKKFGAAPGFKEALNELINEEAITFSKRDNWFFRTPRATMGANQRPPLIKQETDWSCGCAALRSALSFFGIKATESELCQKLGTDELGTEADAFLNAAGYYGVTAEVVTNTTLKELKEGLLSSLVILDLHLWGSGHYVLCFKSDDECIYFMDPWTGEYCSLKWKNFEKNWISNSRGINEENVAIFLKR
jgi:predicted double-glycine peptidase